MDKTELKLAKSKAELWRTWMTLAQLIIATMTLLVVLFR